MMLWERSTLYLRVVRWGRWGRRVVGGRLGVVGGRLGVVGGGFGVIGGGFGWVIDRFLRFVCRSRVVVRFLLWVVRSSLISDLGYITVVVVSSVRHMLSSPVGESNGVGTCRVQTQIGWFVSYLYTSLLRHFHQRSRQLWSSPCCNHQPLRTRRCRALAGTPSPSHGRQAGGTTLTVRVTQRSTITTLGW